jgi:hypothetical protein
MLSVGMQGIAEINLPLPLPLIPQRQVLSLFTSYLDRSNHNALTFCHRKSCLSLPALRRYHKSISIFTV